jgi:heme A synthase
MNRLNPSLLTLTWIALAANFVVILQGAVVRITHSGDGCGRSWPLCYGDIIPVGAATETLIEFSHRLLSLGVLILGVWMWRKARKVRRENPGVHAFSLAAFVFLIIESLFGAALVVFALTGDNSSVARAVVNAAHMVNAMLLMSTLVGAVVYARGSAAWPVRLRAQGLLTGTLALAFAGMLIVMFFGKIAAMGNTIFPSESLAAGLAADFDPESHWMIRIRILHPLIAIVVGIYLFISLGFGWWLKPVREARPLAQWLFGVYVTQLVIGTVNWALLAPAALQLVHLGMAVVAFVLLSAMSLVMLSSDAPLRTPRPLSRQPIGRTG